MRRAYRESVLGLKSKSEPFLQEPQKKFGTPATLSGVRTRHWCRAEGFATRSQSSCKNDGEAHG